MVLVSGQSGPTSHCDLILTLVKFEGPTSLKAYLCDFSYLHI